MIIRILGEGQYDVPDHVFDQLNVHDERLEVALEAGDERTYAVELAELLAAVRSLGTHLPDEELVPSGLVLPGADATMAEVRDLLSGDGLIPGRASDGTGD